MLKAFLYWVGNHEKTGEKKTGVKPGRPRPSHAFASQWQRQVPARDCGCFFMMEPCLPEMFYFVNYEIILTKSNTRCIVSMQPLPWVFLMGAREGCVIH
jgi:hypothetical protein